MTTWAPVKVDGIARLKGKGTGISQLIGKADFWTYSTKEEKTKIKRSYSGGGGGMQAKV